jgi:hypothetical protein
LGSEALLGWVVTCQTTLNSKCGRLAGWAVLNFYFRLARLKQSCWRKNCKSSPFSEPKPLMAEQAGFGGEGEVKFRSPGEIRDARFRETCRTCQDPNKPPNRMRGDNEICIRPLHRTCQDSNKTPKQDAEATTESAFGLCITNSSFIWGWNARLVSIRPHPFP